MPYRDDYNHGLCEDVVGENYPKISEECQAFFDAENCFYECDKNVGKWRRHENCNEEDADWANHNAWEVYKMPIRASTADDMYEACKNDYFPNSKGMWGTEAGGWADAWGDLVKADANGDVRGTCVKGSEIWADGQDMVENVWGEAFKYETDSTKSYVWEFDEGESNPNNKIYENKPYPPSNCSYHSSIDVDKPSANFPDHCPIDWHLDETSGYDWCEDGCCGVFVGYFGAPFRVKDKRLCKWKLESERMRMVSFLSSQNATENQVKSSNLFMYYAFFEEARLENRVNSRER